jgi:hypothetical protein
LEAVGRLGRSPATARWIDLLRRYAPSWLLQLPWLVSADEGADLQRRMGTASRARMLRELAEAVERATAESPLLLALEDLHWSDVSTQELDLLVGLGPVLIATKSQAAAEVEQVYARARTLCAQVGQTSQLFPTLQGLCEFSRNRGVLQTSRELGEQFYQVAQREGGPTPVWRPTSPSGRPCSTWVNTPRRGRTWSRAWLSSIRPRSAPWHCARAWHVAPVAEGGFLLAEALVAFEASERGDMRAEAYRLQGEWLLRQVGGAADRSPLLAEAEACFRQALTLARGQQAKSWELRAALSLSRLCQRVPQATRRKWHAAHPCRILP